VGEASLALKRFEALLKLDLDHLSSLTQEQTVSPSDAMQPLGSFRMEVLPILKSARQSVLAVS